jgi:hypothetical protein
MNTSAETNSHQPTLHSRSNLATACVASCRKLLAGIERTRAAIVREFRDSFQDHEHLLDLAVNEAEALAWESGYPQLFFPTLATEKVQAVANWQARQQLLVRRGLPYADAA